MTRRLLGAALAATALLPATAPAATLNPLKPCYVSVTQRVDGEAPQITREGLDLAGSGFSPNAVVDVSYDGKVETTVQTDAAGNLPAQTLQSPYRASGTGPFTLTAAERGNPLNTVTLTSRNTELSLRLRPRRARPQRKIRFRGRGFTDRRAVYAHYLFDGKVRKTVRLVRQIDNDCGAFSVRRRQIPIKLKRLRVGKWTLQVDQQKRYDPAPESVWVRVKIDVG